MKEQFDNKLRLSKENKEMLLTINEILEEYVDDGYVLTYDGKCSAWSNDKQ